MKPRGMVLKIGIVAAVVHPSSAVLILDMRWGALLLLEALKLEAFRFNHAVGVRIVIIALGELVNCVLLRLEHLLRATAIVVSF